MVIGRDLVVFDLTEEKRTTLLLELRSGGDYMQNVAELSQEDLLKLAEWAAKAPSGHNTQPWQFVLGESSIDIHPDFTKSLPVVDPDNRELYVSLGCATENLCIAASHMGCEATASLGTDGVIHVELTRQSDVVPSKLFSYMATRQTNRSVYNGASIPEEDIRTLELLPAEPGVVTHYYKSGSDAFNTIAQMIYQGNSQQMNDKAFKDELQSWMRYNKKHQDETRDGLSYAVFGAPNLPRCVSKFIMSKMINEKTQNKSDQRKIASSSHLVLLTTQNDTPQQWVTLGRTLERMLLTMTELGVAHAYANPPNEIRELARVMARKLGIADEYPTIILRIGYAQPVPYSLRREVSSQIIAPV